MGDGIVHMVRCRVRFAMCVIRGVFLQTVETPLKRLIFRSAAFNALEMRQHSCGNLPCRTKNYSFFRHSADLKKHPRGDYQSFAGG